MSSGFNTIVSKTSGSLDSSPSSKRLIALIDMDSFFASCEEAANPHLRKYPVIICGRFERGVVTTANRLAKEKYGISVGMSGTEAKRLCPQGKFIAGDFDKYVYFSKRINQIVRTFSPQIEPYSIDEIFLDLTECPGTGDLFKLGTCIKKAISSELNLPSTIGFGPNRLIAKMACSLGKPNGLCILDENSYREKLWPKRLVNIWGIGRKGEKNLNKLGIQTIGQLAQYPLKALKANFGLRGQWYHDMAWGRDDSQVGKYNDKPQVSYGHSYTLEKDSLERDVIQAVLFRLCDKCTTRLRRDRLSARTIHMSFETEYGLWGGNQVTLSQPIFSDIEVFKVCQSILENYHLKEPVRRLSMRVSNLVEMGSEIEFFLFDSARPSQEKFFKVFDQIRSRYGDKTLIRGRQLIDFRSLKAVHFQTARRFQSGEHLPGFPRSVT